MSTTTSATPSPAGSPGSSSTGRSTTTPSPRDDARFLTALLQYFPLPFDIGPRKAKELLFTGEWLSAEEALRLGMVNHVVPRAELHEFTLDLARRIARRPSFALKLAKESVNEALDAQGQWTALRAAFSKQHLAHAHNRLRFGRPVDPAR